MKTLSRNKQLLYYALYTGVQELTDANGDYTGEYAPIYGTPVAVQMNISAARGTATVEPFGIDTPYTHKLVTDDMNCPINEDSVLWIGVTPESSSTPYTHVVTGVAKSLNSITYAIKAVIVR